MYNAGTRMYHIYTKMLSLLSCKTDGMKSDGLASYIADLASANEVKEIRTNCDPELEMCELAHRMFAGGVRDVLFFTNTGTRYPVAMNLYASESRLLARMGANDCKALQQRIVEFFDAFMRPPKGLKTKWEILRSLYKLGKLGTRSISGKAPCQECIDRAPDLSTLPILKCWPHDGGRFVTLPMVITQDVETGVRNVGMYRMQVIDSQTTAMHWHIHKTGAKHFSGYKARNERMPVAVALGGDPLLAYCATAPLPEGIDEFLFAGFLRKRAVPMVKGVTVPIEVPAEADIILEGYIDPSETPFWEGPFGDHTGFYSLEDWYPKFHVTCITTRRDAVYPATIVGIPPMEDSVIAHVTERIFEPLIKRTLIPELKDLYLPTEGVAHNLAIVHGQHAFAGSGEKIANAIWSSGQLMFTKYIIRIPDACSLSDSEAMLRLLANVKLQDLFFSRGPEDILDHASEEVGFGSKLFIDCYYQSVINGEIRWTEQAKHTLGGRSLWIGDRLLLQIVEDYEPFEKHIAQKLLMQCTSEVGTAPRFVLLINQNAPQSDPRLLLWFILANTAPARDIWIANDGDDFSAIIDARSKIGGNYLRQWPNVVCSSEATINLVDQRWREYGLHTDLLLSPSRMYRKMLINYDSATANPWKDIVAQTENSH